MNIRELLVQAAVDTGIPRTVGEYLGWLIRFALRLWDEPIVREWESTRAELKEKGIYSTTYTKEYEYALAKRTGRNVFSVRRSLKRIAAREEKSRQPHPSSNWRM